MTSHPENVTFVHSKLLLYNCKFHSIKDEQLDTITLPSLILLLLTMVPSLCLISSKQTVSSNQCLCCSTGLKVIVTQDKTPNVGAGDPSSTILIDHGSYVVLPTIDRVAHQGHTSWGLGGSDPRKYVGRVRVCFDCLKMSHSFIRNCCV